MRMALWACQSLPQGLKHVAPEEQSANGSQGWWEKGMQCELGCWLMGGWDRTKHLEDV